MIRQDQNRLDTKRRAGLNHKKQQFAVPAFQAQDYPYRLNFYQVPPTSEITLEEFEQWAIDRLRSMCAVKTHILTGLADHTSSC